MNRRLDPVALVFGLFFLGIAGVWVAWRVLDLHAGTVGWIVAGGLVALGVAGLAGILTASRRHADDPDQ